MSKVKIARFSLNGNFRELHIHFFDNDGEWCGVELVRNRYDRDEDEYVELLLDMLIGKYYSRYLIAISVEQLRLDVIEGFRQLRQNDLDGNMGDDMEVFLVPKKQTEPHFSCKMNQNEDSTTQSSGENENSHLKYNKS